MLGELVEPVPAELLSRHGFPGSAAALKAAHFPEDEADAELALRRLAWEECLIKGGDDVRVVGGPGPWLAEADRLARDLRAPEPAGATA